MHFLGSIQIFLLLLSLVFAGRLFAAESENAVAEKFQDDVHVEEILQEDPPPNRIAEKGKT